MQSQSNKKILRNIALTIVGLLLTTQCAFAAVLISEADKEKLFNAAKDGKHAIVDDYLVRYGVSPNVSDVITGNTLLNTAVESWIDAKHVQAESFFFSRAYWQAYMKSRNLLTLITNLLSKTDATARANPDYANLMGISPIHKVVQEAGAEELLILLLERGANPNRMNDNFQTPLQLATDSGLANNVKLLLRYGARPNIQDSVGNTALHYAARNNDGKIAELLLASGADPEIKNNRGEAAIVDAATAQRLLGNYHHR